jgi:hypothetical protein
LRFIGKIPQLLFLMLYAEILPAKLQRSFYKILLAGAVTTVTVEAEACGASPASRLIRHGLEKSGLSELVSLRWAKGGTPCLGSKPITSR